MTEDVKQVPVGAHLVEKHGKKYLDQGRQWPRSINDMVAHHRVRYKFAAKAAIGRTLDAACGVGYGSWILSKKCEVVGVDINAPAIAWAKRYFEGPEYICGDISASPWKGSFDTIVSLETIEHIKDPSAALKAFRRSCTGRLIASVPNQEIYPFKAEDFVNDESPHYRHYTPDEFTELLETNGFNVLDRFNQLDKINCGVVNGTKGKFLIYVCE